jgi:hypothetical protein
MVGDRYLDEEMCVKESFLGFAEASSTTGEELATTIMTKLREYGIVTQAMRGQCYDGAANMADKFSSALGHLFFFVHQEHLIALHLSVVTWF